MTKLRLFLILLNVNEPDWWGTWVILELSNSSPLILMTNSYSFAFCKEF